MTNFYTNGVIKTVPEGWVLGRNKMMFDIISRKVGSNSSEYDLLSLTLGGIKLRDIDSGKGKFPAEFDTYQEVHPDDLVFCLFDIDETPRTVGLSRNKGMITGAYTVVRCKQNIDPRYVYYYYLSVDYVKKLKPFYTGLRKVVRPNAFLNIPAPIPPYDKQKEIADFLDSEISRTDRLIEKKERFLKIISEKRSSIITTAVTKGIDPNAHMKESGIDWLGKIPQRWIITKLKFIGNAVIGLTYSPEDVVDEGDGILVYRSANIQNGKISLKDNVYVKKEIPNKLLTREGDILICSRNGSRALIGKNALIDKDTEGHSFGAFTTVFRTKHYDFIYFVMNSELFNYQSGMFLTSTINQLTTGTLNNFEVPLPPEDEQKIIVEDIQKKIAPLESLETKISQSIEKLSAFKTAIITQAVTGQLDIHTWQKRGVADRRLDQIEEEMEQKNKKSKKVSA